MITTEPKVESPTKSLEQEHAETYQELIETIDELLIKTKLSTLDPKQISSEYNRFKPEIKDLQSMMLHNEKFSSVDKDNDELLNDSLEQLIKLRLDIFNQHLITHSNLKIIHGDDNQINYKKLNKLIQDKDFNDIKLQKKLNDDNIKKELRELKVKNQRRLEYCQSEITEYLELIKENNDLKLQNQISDENDEIDGTLQILKSKYLNVSRKNMMLSQFNFNLISSLSNADLYNDEKLKEILLSCGDYDDYCLLDDEIEES